jgi:hypothetical protein
MKVDLHRSDELDAQAIEQFTQLLNLTAVIGGNEKAVHITIRAFRAK